MALPPPCQQPYLPRGGFAGSIAAAGGPLMASVFLSYDHEDAGRAAPIVAALEQAGHSVWWDRHIPGGAQYNDAIEGAVERADVVVVLWSERSAKSPWVRDEAAEGRDRGKLVPGSLDGAKPPMGFRQYQTIDLSRRKGNRIANVDELLRAIDDSTGDSKPAGHTAAPVVAPARRASGRRAPILIGVIVLVLAGVGLGLWWFRQSASAVPVVAIAPADSSPASQVLARDLLTKLGSLQAARTDALDLVGGGSGDPAKADLVFQASAGGGGTSAGNLVLLSGGDRSVLWSKDFSSPGGQQALEQSMSYTAGQVLDCALQARAPSAQLDAQTAKLFLNGCALYAERSFSVPASVVPIFTQIVSSAPRFLPAWAKLLLAESQATRAQMLFYDRYVPGDLPQHIEAVAKLDSKLPELYLAKNSLLPFSAMQERFRLLDTAVQLGPNDPNPFLTRSIQDAEIGTNSDAINDARRAAELDPLSPGFESNLIQTLAYAGQIAPAQQELERAEELWPGSAAIEDAHFRFASRFGDPHEALKMLQSAGFRQQYPTNDMETYLLARIEPSKDNVDHAVAAAQSPELAPGRRIGQVVQVLGQFGRENDLYAMMMGFTPAQLIAARPALFRPPLHKFRQDPRFMILAKRAGLVDFWRKTGKWPDFCFEPDLPYDCKAEAAKLSA
jgi:tetratricopeptide (TPR) repeat protein